MKIKPMRAASPWHYLQVLGQFPKFSSEGRGNHRTVTKGIEVAGSTFTRDPTPLECALSSLLVLSLIQQGPWPPTSPSSCLGVDGHKLGF